jgi:ATP-dependent Zn protease
MPGPGESRDGVADVFMHVHTRVIELVAGSVAEALFLLGEPWPADSDRAQERALAALICSSPESIEAFIDFCMAEAAALLRPREHILRALTAELLVRRTMNGDQVDEIITAAAAAKAAADERERRAAWAQTCANAAKFEPD